MITKVGIKKRDGLIEEFSSDKIARVAQAAGLESNQAKILAQKIADWVDCFNQSVISSLQIRDKVAEELFKVNKNAADLFTWYEKKTKS